MASSRTVLMREVLEMPNKLHRQALYLMVDGDMPMAELGVMLNVPEDEARVIYCDALVALRRRLGPSGTGASQ